MDYEKRYKALLEQAKEELKTCGSLDCDAAKQIFRFFPELKESEDERIRKAAIAFVKASDHFGYHLGISKENVLSWLEKQGEPIDKEKVKIGARKDLALSIINYLDNNRVAGCMCLSSMECEDIEDACINSKWTKLYNYMKKKLETPDVSDYNPYKATVKSIITMTERYANGNDLRDFYDNVKVKCKEAVDYDKTWLEKTSKQWSTDEPELRFKVGDWVVQKNGDTFYGGARTVQISKIEGDKIWFTSGTWLTSYYIRHWNIEDAKDGDVLARNNDMLSICIFAHFSGINNRYSSFLCHCGLEDEGLGQQLSINGYHDDCKDYVPATKEQRDILFAKMKEAGYEWDADKKNIKKQDEPKDYNSIDPHFGKPIETESKFKVGDWIAANRANFRSPIKIVGISNTEYRTEDTKGNSGVSYIDYLDSRFHPWSIADAKDGDILISACNHPFIYNGNSDASLVGGYGGIATACGFKPSAEKCHWTENINIHPATKEEQEYLFQKMAKAGYMWDSYTKSVFCMRNSND